MARLVLNRVPASSSLKRGTNFPLKADVLRLGSHPQMEIYIPADSVAERHALLQLGADEQFSILDLGSESGTFVDGERLSRSRNRILHDGCHLRLGQVEFVFSHADSSVAVEQKRTFMEWWEDVAVPAPSSLTLEQLEEMTEVCGSAALSRKLLNPQAALDWYAAYYEDQRAPCLPMPVSYLIDLASLIIFRDPPLRTLASGQSASCRGTLRVNYYTGYQQRHLSWLRSHVGVQFIRERVSRAKIDAETRSQIVVRFVADVARWATQAWLAKDYQGDDDARNEVYKRCSEDRMRILIRPQDVMSFLVQLSDAISNINSLHKILQRSELRELLDVIPPIERFVLGARPQIREAFDHMNEALVSECLKSRQLEERDYSPMPVDIDPSRQRIPSRNPGGHTSIKGIAKTSRFDELPDVIPADLAVSALPDGHRILLEQLTHEGLNKNLRENYDDEIERKRYFACFRADIGTIVAGNVGRQRVELDDWASADTHPTDHVLSPAVHASRLIFEFLRDLGQYLGPLDIDLEIAVFLETLRQRSGKRLSYRITLDELKRDFGKSTYNDMVELERRAAGYFFRDRITVCSALDFEHTLQQAYEVGRYDTTLFMFLGPSATVGNLFPIDLPSARSMAGLHDTVMLVRMNQVTHGIEVAVGERFDEMQVQPVFAAATDEELRFLVLERLLGVEPGSKAAPLEASL